MHHTNRGTPDMAKKGSVKARKKAVKKLDKAVKKAVKKGVPEDVLEQTVNDAIESAETKESPVKRSTARPSSRTKKKRVPTAKTQDEDLD
jgi:transcriptional/translational regulatory protein YebC/TACO1